MNPLAVFSGAAQSVFPLAARPRLWFPFFALGAVQLLLLWLLLSFHNPVILPLAVPFLKSVGGEGIVHYPFFYYGLPLAFLRVNLALAIVLETLTSGVATLLFAMAFSGGNHQGAWAKTVRRYPTLFLLGFVVVGLSFAMSFLPQLVSTEAFVGSAAVRWGTRIGMLVLNAVVQTLLAFTTAWVILKGRGFLPAIAKSIGLGLQTFLPTFLLILIASLIFFPLDYLSGRPDLIVEKLRPETVFWLLGLRSLVQVLIGFFLTGAITYIFVWKKGGIE